MGAFEHHPAEKILQDEKYKDNIIVSKTFFLEIIHQIFIQNKNIIQLSSVS